MTVNSISTTFDNYNKNYTFYVPLHSKILDIFIDGYNQLYLSYSREDNEVNTQNKDVFVHVIQAYTPNEYVLDNYKFLRSSDVINIVINNTTSGNTISINQEVIKRTYLIFLDENKQPAEKREDNLNKILY